MKKKTIITYGTFDMFHIGHLNLLKKLSKKGNKLIVAVSTDEFNKQKGKKALIPYKQRKKIVEAIEFVDKVIPEKSWDQKIDDIKKYKADVFAIGEDWEGEFDFLEDYCKVDYIQRTKNVSSTKLKKSLQQFLSVSPEDFLAAFKVLKALKKDFE